MATRRASRSRQRNTPWDSSDPANWTAAKLQTELEKINVYVPVSLGKNTLRKIYVENLSRRNHPSEVDQNTAVHNRNDVLAIANNTDNTVQSNNNESMQSNTSTNAIDTPTNDIISDNAVCNTADTRINTQSSRSGSRSNMAAPSTNVNNGNVTAVMTSMMNAMQSMQQTMLGLQQTVIKLVNDKNSNATHSLTTAYASLRERRG